MRRASSTLLINRLRSLTASPIAGRSRARRLPRKSAGDCSRTSRISSRFKVSVSDLRRWNALPKNKYLQPGKRLKLYVDVTRQTES